MTERSRNKIPQLEKIPSRPEKTGRAWFNRRDLWDTERCRLMARENTAADTFWMNKVKKEYLLPNYVAGCCRYAGWDGIKYRGSGYKCYVTWNDASMEIEEYYSPIKISEWKKSKK